MSSWNLKELRDLQKKIAKRIILKDLFRKPITSIMGIDLAFKEPDGWVIADYKSDKVDENLADLVSYYKPQVEMYREFWKEISKEDVKETGLYFVDIQKWISI